MGTVPDWVPRETDSKREIRMFTRESFEIGTSGGRKLAVRGLPQPRQTSLPANFSGWQQQAFLEGDVGSTSLSLPQGHTWFGFRGTY